MRIKKQFWLLIALLAFASFAAALPSATITAPAFTNSQTPTFTITYSDANGMELSCNGSFSNSFVAISGTYSGLDITSCIPGEGSKQAFLRVESSDANTFDTNTWLVYDTTKPTITAVAPSGLQTSDFDVNFTISDTLSGIASASYTSPTFGNGTIPLDQNKITISTDGNHAITYYATDNAGNQSDSSVVYAALDKTSPSTSIASIGGDSSSPYWDVNNDSQTSIVISGESGMLCRWGTADAVWSSMTNECSVSGTQATCNLGSLSQGSSQAYYISCKDSAGNEQTNAQNIDLSFGVDWTAPSITSAGPSGVQSSSSVTLTAATNEASTCKYGISDVSYDSMSGSSSASATSHSWSLTNLTDGSYAYYIRCRDSAGLDSDKATTSFTVSTTPLAVPDSSATDTTNPTVHWVEPINNATVYGIVKLKASASDNKGIKSMIFYYGSKMIARVSSKEGDYYVADWNTIDLNETTYQLSAIAYDTSNNSASDLITVKISKTPITQVQDENEPIVSVADENESVAEKQEGGSKKTSANTASGLAAFSTLTNKNIALAVMIIGIIALALMAYAKFGKGKGERSFKSSFSFEKIAGFKSRSEKNAELPKRNFKRQEKKEEQSSLSQAKRYKTDFEDWN